MTWQNLLTHSGISSLLGAVFCVHREYHFSPPFAQGTVRCRIVEDLNGQFLAKLSHAPNLTHPSPPIYGPLEIAPARTPEEAFENALKSIEVRCAGVPSERIIWTPID